MLYFKFQKVMINFFAAWSVVAAVTMYFNYQGSGYSTSKKNELLGLNGITYGIFFTTLGSWGEKTIQCETEDEGGNIELQCATGVITSIEAYYGQPTGSCSCPIKQQLVEDSDTGDLTCPSKVKYGNNNYGTCSLSGSSSEEKYCLQGTTPYGAACCASTDNGAPNYSPNFDDLLPAPNRGCDSDTAQYIANQA